MRVRKSLVALLAVAAVAVAACGSSGSSGVQSVGDSGNSGSEGTPATGGSGLSGKPIKVGFINQSAGAHGAYPEADAAAAAAVKYINEEKGGVGGRPIDLVTCAGDGTLASEQKCAQEMVQKDVVFVVGGLNLHMDSWYSILGPAGIPVINGIPITTSDFSAKDAFDVWGGTATAAPALAVYVHKFLPKVKSVGLLIGSEAASTIVPLAKKPLNAWGIKTHTVLVPDTQNDWTAPFIQAAKGSGAIIVMGSAPNCISAIQAAKAQSNKLPVIAINTCFSKSISKAVGNAEEGWIVPWMGPAPLGNSPDAKVYQSVMKRYIGSDANLGGFAPYAFTNIMSAYEGVLKPLAGKVVNPKSVLEQVTSPSGGDVFLGSKYKCPGEPLSSVCNYDMMFFTVHDQKLSKPTNFVSVAGAVKLALK